LETRPVTPGSYQINQVRKTGLEEVSACPVDDFTNVDSKQSSSLAHPYKGKIAFEKCPTHEKSQASEFRKGFVKNYLDAAQVETKVNELAEKYPNLVTVVTGDNKTSGYDGKVNKLQGSSSLRYVKIGPKNESENENKNNKDKVGVLLMASPHAREVVNPLVMLETMEQLLANYDPESKDPKVKDITEMVDSLNIYMAPVTNPDGLNYAMHDDPMWRKNRSNITGDIPEEMAWNIAENITPKESEENISHIAQQIQYEITDTVGCGVDVNRNFDYKWAPTDPTAITFSGEGPFSEPESRHILQIVEDNPDIKFIADFHSRGEEVRRPVNAANDDDRELYYEIQTRMSNAIEQHRGKEYEPLISLIEEGAADDYFYQKKGIYSVVVESLILGDTYRPDLPEALEVVEEVSEGAKEFLRFARDYGNKQKEQ
jgi:hypothetical protein